MFIEQWLSFENKMLNECSTLKTKMDTVVLVPDIIT